MARPDRTVDHGLRLADHGACVPWDAMAAIERAQADAAARRRLAGPERAADGILRRFGRWVAGAGARRAR